MNQNFPNQNNVNHFLLEPYILVHNFPMSTFFHGSHNRQAPKNLLNIKKIYKLLQKIFWKDTENERNYLIKNVYPKLRNYFNTEYGVDFQVKLILLRILNSLLRIFYV